MAQLSRGISQGIFGAIALSVTFGAVASGRDLTQPNTSSTAEASASPINRAAKADRAARVAGPAIQTQTIALRLNDLANTSVLIRMPVAQAARNSSSGSLLLKSGEGKAHEACEPVVSVLTEVAKRLQPGRCVT